jgi:protein-S-isoprenylcysteine O-methyltransferase Ste14
MTEPRQSLEVSRVVGVIAYGALFTLLLPAALALWAARLDRIIDIPAIRLPLPGLVMIALGVGFALWATTTLRVKGGGLPMSPYPPPRRAECGPYRLVPHPIYAGFVFACAGAAIAAGSAAGLFIVTPLLILAIASFVIGFERDATLARIGPPTDLTILRLPPDREESASWKDRVSVVVLVLLPWLLVYGAIVYLPAPAGAVSTLGEIDRGIPVLPWTEIVYAAAYPFVVIVSLLARTSAQLRRFSIRGWLATVFVGSIQLLVPLVFPPKAVTGDGALEALMRLERSLDAAGAAFPAFHVVWALLAAAALAEARPRLRPLWWAAAVAISVSCVTTGMHSVADVIAGVAAFGIVIAAPRIWMAIRAAAERLCNSWQEWTFGPLRVMNHSFFALASSWPGLVVADSLTGGAMTGALLAIAFTSVAGAAIWAQLLEGSSQLLRPFGYFGAVAGAMLACAAFALIGGDGMVLLAGVAVGAPLMHAIARGRCLIQGCCHGAPAPESVGIRYTHPRSRVTRLSPLGGVPLHPTPVYSMASSLVTLAILVRIWSLGAPAEALVGFYLVLTGIARFTEEHFRGEPQTKVFGGLHIYQWLSIAFVVGGAALSVAGRTAMPGPAMPDLRSLLSIGAFALFAAAAYGADFPRANFRFSRLV